MICKIVCRERRETRCIAGVSHLDTWFVAADIFCGTVSTIKKQQWRRSLITARPRGVFILLSSCTHFILLSVSYKQRNGDLWPPSLRLLRLLNSSRKYTCNLNLVELPPKDKKVTFHISFTVYLLIRLISREKTFTIISSLASGDEKKTWMQF